MRGLFAVAGLSLLKAWKEKTFILLMVGLALLFASVTGMVFGRTSADPRIPVAVADLDDSALSRSMAGALVEEGIYDVSSLSKDDIYTAVREGKVDAGFVIPQGFEKSLTRETPLNVEVVTLAASNTSIVIRKTLERKVTEHLLVGAVREVAQEQAEAWSLSGSLDLDSLAAKVSEDYLRRQALVVELDNVREDAAESDDSPSTYVTGIYIMFTMFTVVFTAGDILQERRDGTWLRLMASPASRASIMGGKVLGAYVIGAVQLALLFVAGRYLFGVGCGSNPLGLALVMGAFLLAVTGLGIMLSTLVRTVAQLQTLAPIVIVATCMLGGCYWPLDVVSPLMRTIAKFTPQVWAMTAAADIVAKGMSVAGTSRNILMLLLFAAVFFSVGVSRVKYE